MFYFIRTVVLYLVLFMGMAVGIQKGFHKYYFDKTDQDVAIGGEQTIFGIPNIYSQPRMTESGLYLAGLSAQSQRDWGSAWQSFSTLNHKFDNNPQIALRAFTLAMGNGDFRQASEIANNIKSKYFDNKNADTELEAYDLVRLYLLLEAVKTEQFDSIDSFVDDIHDGALSQFSSPIITAWVKPETITTKIPKTGSVQTYYIALAAEYHDKNDVAKSLFKSIENDVGSVYQLLSMASYYVRQNDIDYAIMLLEANKKRFGNDTEILNQLDNLKTDPEKFESSSYADYHLKGANTAIALAFHDFGRLMMSERAIDSALLFSRMATYMDASLLSVYMTIGDILEYQGQDVSALNAYKMITPEDDMYEAALTKRINILIEQERYDESQDILENAITKYPKNPYFHYILGNIHKALKNYKRAIEYYDIAETLGKHDGDLERSLWPLYYSRAIAFDLSDQWDNAEKDLVVAMDKFPNSPIILNYLGYAYADRGLELEKAKELISQAVMAAPNDGYIIDSMGWILYRMGDYEQAVQYLERAASLRPYHMVINDHLGDAYWKVGRKLEAYYMWQRALDYYDDNEEEQRRMIDETRRKVNDGL